MKQAGFGKIRADYKKLYKIIENLSDVEASGLESKFVMPEGCHHPVTVCRAATYACTYVHTYTYTYVCMYVCMYVYEGVIVVNLFVFIFSIYHIIIL